MNLLCCRNLSLGYSLSKPLVTAFDFDLQEGEVVALLGANGSGKSTFLKTLNGVVTPLSGSVQLLDRTQWDARSRAQVIALVRMGAMAPARMRVREFVGLGRMPYTGLFDGHTAEDRKKVDEALALLNLEKFAERWMTELSDGERSRVYLAEALAQEVRVLLLDEPNAFLDIPHSRKLFSTLRELAEEKKMGIVVSTHSVEYAERYCHRIFSISGGQARAEKAEEARAKGLLDWTESDPF